MGMAKEIQKQARTISAITNDVPVLLRVWFIGSGAPTLTVDASSDITFLVGGVADTNISTDGKIDVSGSAEDTLGEIADIINASNNWRCAIVDGIRADSVAGAQIKASQHTAAVVPVNGLDIVADVSVYNGFCLSLGAEAVNDSTMNAAMKQSAENVYDKPEQIAAYAATSVFNLAAPRPTTLQKRILTNARLYEFVALINTSAGASTLNIYSSSQSADLLLGSYALADNTEVNKLFEDNAEWASRPGERLVIRAKPDTDEAGNATAGYLTVRGAWSVPGQLAS